MDTLNTIMFIVSALSVLLALYNFAQKRTAEKGKVINKPIFSFSDSTYWIIIGVIAIVGVGIRVWQCGSVPAGFNQDGAMASVDAKALADYATDRFGTFMPAHLYAWGFGQMSSLLSYLIAIFVKLFGLNEITARLPQLLASLAGGTFFFLFMKDTFGKSAGLFAALFVAINPWHLLQSRWALDCNLLPHFFMGGIYFLNRGLGAKKRYVYISMIFFGLCMYCYGITIYTIPVFLIAVCIYYLIKKKITVQDALISAGIYLLIAWPFILTMMVNFFKWETIKLPFVTIQQFSGSTRASDILLFSDNFLQQLGANIRSLLNTTIFQKKDLPWNDIEGFGTMFVFSIPFMITGVVELRRAMSERSKGLVTFALLTGIWAGLLTNNVNVNRINIVYYGMMMFIVLGIVFVVREFRFARFAPIAAYTLAGIILISTYFGAYADLIGFHFFYGFGEAFDVAKAAGTQKIYITTDVRGEGEYALTEIITMFHDETDAMYYQGKSNINNGVQMLPYKERFNYVNMDASVVAKGKAEDAAFVITDDDLVFFSESEYTITNFGNFCAAVRK